MINYLCLMGGAIFGFLIGGMMAAAHDDPFASTAGETIEELLGKAEPQVPYLTTYDDDLKYVCPECLYGFSKDERPDYCPGCGQHINWEGCDD